MGKNIWGSKPRVNFILKKPGGGRRTFQILKRTTRPGACRPEHVSVTDPRLDSLNRAFLAGQGFAESELQAREIIADLQAGARRRAIGVAVHNEENRRILSAYWERHFAHRVYEVEDSETSMRNRLSRAVDAMGSLSLVVASKEALQAAIDRKYRDHRQRALVASLNGILKHLGRDFELTPRPKRRKQPRHLKLKDFERVNRHTEDRRDQLLQRVAFATGLRTGELFALSEDSVQGRHFFAEGQMDRALTLRGTKTRDETRRRIYVIPGFENDVQEWCRIPADKKREIRGRKHAAILKSACEVVYPDRPETHCAFHDLRHSIAVHLAQMGVPISRIAKCLNESELVCQEYYGGFYPHDDTIDAIDMIMRPGGGMVDTADLKSAGASPRRAGSTPALGTH
jgi:integrase